MEALGYNKTPFKLLEFFSGGWTVNQQLPNQLPHDRYYRKKFNIRILTEKLL